MQNFQLGLNKVNRIATVCVRGGSKGVAKKNLKNLFGKPLLAHAIVHAKESNLFSAVAVSSDDPEMLTCGKKWGADFCVVRPNELANDSAPKVPAIRHCVVQVEKESGIVFDTVVDLDATAPLRQVIHICEAVKKLEESDACNLFSVTRSRKSPYFNIVELNERGYAQLAKPLPKTITSRQQSPICFDINAAIYVWRRAALNLQDNVFLDKALIYEMPAECSIDIDSEFDFELVEFLAAKRGVHG